MPDIARAIAALTFDEIHDQDGNTPPLLSRSIATELREIDKAICKGSAQGSTRLFAIADAIDDALLDLAEV